MILREHLSKTGKWGFVLSLLFVFSISAKYRLPVAGLLMHPFLLLLPFAIFFSGIQISNIPRRVLYPLVTFFVIFSVACLQNKHPIFEMIKVGASLLVFLFFATSIKTERDFRWMCWGLLIVGLEIGILGFFKGEEIGVGGGRQDGINVLEGLGNKNAQSLYTLPGLFFGISLILHYLKVKKMLPVAALGASIFFITIDIFLSANRSGWVGLIIVFISFMIYSGLQLRTIVIGCMLAVFGYIAINNYASDVYEHKKKQTLEGFSSDTGRKMLMRESIIVGFENPLLGVGFEDLQTEMAVRLGLNRYGRTNIDTHFLIGYIFGSTGIFSMFFFFLFFIRLAKNYDKKISSMLVRKEVKSIRVLLIAFIILFFLRSFFTREILYSPTFMGGLGLLYGYYLMKAKSGLETSTSIKNL